MHPSPPLPWEAIDTVLLDMDGTLLDLRFDNWFWQEHVPAVWARARGMSYEAALEELTPRFDAARGRLDWYCIDYWSGELGLDVRAIKHGVREQVAWVPGALRVLGELKARGKRRVLVTNAHPEALAIKDAEVGLSAHLDAVCSSHAFGLPKEDPGFWPRLQAATGFGAATTLFVDDSLAVLAAARDYGIGWLRAVRRPDSTRPARDTGAYPSVESIDELL
jgi:HAD superfamily hydrolase (TIGR01509 family)